VVLLEPDQHNCSTRRADVGEHDSFPKAEPLTAGLNIGGPSGEFEGIPAAGRSSNCASSVTILWCAVLHLTSISKTPTSPQLVLLEEGLAEVDVASVAVRVPVEGGEAGV
jgi:hypothetical protein